jgi:hypothetical protein
MQVSSTPAQMSALDIWLRETESVASPGGMPPAAGDATPAGSELAAPGPRDIAEGLLELQVWTTSSSGGGAAAVASRQLATADQGPEHADATTAQLWAQHIFAPLEPRPSEPRL